MLNLQRRDSSVFFSQHFAGNTVNMGECMAQNANPIAIFMAKKEFFITISRMLLHLSIDRWTLYQCFGPHLQSKNR